MYTASSLSSMHSCNPRSACPRSSILILPFLTRAAGATGPACATGATDSATGSVTVLFATPTGPSAVGGAGGCARRTVCRAGTDYARHGLWWALCKAWTMTHARHGPDTPAPPRGGLCVGQAWTTQSASATDYARVPHQRPSVVELHASVSRRIACFHQSSNCMLPSVVELHAFVSRRIACFRQSSCCILPSVVELNASISRRIACFHQSSNCMLPSVVELHASISRRIAYFHQSSFA
jgi:hypothetical protein